jgi:hypothetical protein
LSYLKEVTMSVKRRLKASKKSLNNEI